MMAAWRQEPVGAGMRQMMQKVKASPQLDAQTPGEQLTHCGSPRREVLTHFLVRIETGIP
jgi:hypothetical protein